MEGGRKTSYDLCFGKEFGKPMPTVDSRNSQGKIPASTTFVSPSCNSRILSDTFVISRTNSLLTPRSPIWMPRNYELTFLLKPTGIQPQWANILRFGRTNDANTLDVPEDCCMHGVRAIGVWFWPGTTRLHIIVSHERNGNWGDDTPNLQIGTTYQITIRAQGEIVYFRVIDINKSTPLFEWTYYTSHLGSRYEGWASVWGADGWYTPAKGIISDLCLKNL